MKRYGAYKVGLKILLAAFLLYGLYLVWAIIALGGGCNRMEPETHIIPYGYSGTVFIVFDQEDGYLKEYWDDGSRLYRIPQSGLLKTRFKRNYGWGHYAEQINFYYSNNESIWPIDKYLIEKDTTQISQVDSNHVVVFEYGFGMATSDLKIGGDILTYIVDSLKNFRKRDYKLTKDRFENWK